MNNHTGNTKSFLTAIGIIAIAASTSLAGSMTSSDGHNPKPGESDPFGNLPFEDLFDPDQMFDPLEKDDIPPTPRGYIDIPEIDREPEGDGGINSPVGSALPFPGDLLNPITVEPNPFLLPPTGFDDEFFSELGRPGGSTVSVPFDAGAVPTPGTAFLGGLAAAAFLRRRR